MILQFQIPAPPLGAYIELITYYKGYNPPHTIERLLPDGGIDLLIDLTAIPKYIYDNDSLEKIQTCKKTWISGMRTGYISIQAAAEETEMIVVRFRPGMAWSVMHISALEIRDLVVDAELLFGNELLALREQVMAAAAPDQKIQLVEDYLLQRIKKNPDVHPAIYYSIACIHQSPSQSTISEISRKTGYSNKHLISLFGKFAGITPKQYISVIRFQQAIQMLEQQPEKIHWAGMALDCGYYDQAHFINEFRRFSGLNPTAYMEAKGDFLNYIPVKVR